MKDLPNRAQIVIVGGGIAGCCLAYHLAARGIVDVLLVEQNELGAGTTWHAAGAVGRMRTSATLAKLNDRSATMYAGLSAEVGMQTGWVQNGSLTIARVTDRMVQLRRAGAMAARFGVDVREIAPSEAAAMWPLADMADVIGAMWLPNDGIVEPLQLTLAVAEGARRRGVTILEHVGVEQLVVVDGRIAGVRASGQLVEAETVVMCAGMWTPQLAALSGVTVPIQPVEHHYVMSNKLDEAVDDAPVVRDPDGCIYFRGRDGALMLGAFQPVSKPWAVDRVPDNFAFQLLGDDWEHFAPPLAEGLRRLPQIEALGIEAFVNGPEGFTPDGNALVGEVPNVAGLFVMAGFNSSGLAFSGGVGEALAHWIAEGESPIDLWMLDIRRFSPLQAERRFLRARAAEVLGTHMRMTYPGIEWAHGRDLIRSPLHDDLAAAGAQFGEKLGNERANWFARDSVSGAAVYSFERPGWFADSAAEHHATRDGVTVADLSSFGKIRVHGRDALALLQHACANEINVPVDTVVYTAMLSARGTFASDVTVVRVADDDFTVITGTAQRIADVAWLRRHAPRLTDVHVDDVTEATSVIAVMGPGARRTLSSLGDADLSHASFPFSTSQCLRIAGVACRALRITYVGELGWELHVAPADSVALYRALRGAGVGHCGYYAINSLRLEKGYRAWGTDIGLNDTPIEAGLGFAVAWTKPDFHGRDALLRVRDASSSRPRKRLASIVLDDPGPVLWGGERIFRDGTCIGHTTSGAYGHTVGYSVALGYVEVDHAASEGPCEVDIAGDRAPARAMCHAPFDPSRKRVLT